MAALFVRCTRRNFSHHRWRGFHRDGSQVVSWFGRGIWLPPAQFVELDPVVLIAASLGVFFLLVRRRWREVGMVAATPMVYIAVLDCFFTREVRYILMMLPLLAVAGGGTRWRRLRAGCPLLPGSPCSYSPCLRSLPLATIAY